MAPKRKYWGTQQQHRMKTYGFARYSHDKTYVIAMDSTGHVHMDACGFKREQVICSDNVWLSEVMLWKRCGARDHRHPMVDFWIPNVISYGHWRAVLPHSNPRAYTRFSQETHKKSHKNHTRFTLESHKIFTRIPSVLTRSQHRKQQK